MKQEGAPRSRWRCFPSEALPCPGLLSGFSDRPALGSGPQSLLASMWWWGGGGVCSFHQFAVHPPCLVAPSWRHFLRSSFTVASCLHHSCSCCPAFCVVRLISPLDPKDVTENLDSSKEPGVKGNLYVKSEVSIYTNLYGNGVQQLSRKGMCFIWAAPPWGGHHQPSSPSSPPRCEAGHKHLEVMEVWGENGSRAASAEKLSS